jgi:hypothetical protein
MRFVFSRENHWIVTRIRAALKIGFNLAIKLRVIIKRARHAMSAICSKRIIGHALISSRKVDQRIHETVFMPTFRETAL